jgi:catechol 2,3-dioxygenase-like lactoylglutathione lyase family enzyme
MKKIASFFASVCLCLSASTVAGTPPKRPRILGLAGVTILVSDLPAAVKFYRDVADPLHACNFCEEIPSRVVVLSSKQKIVLEEMPSPAPANLIAEVSFCTDDLPQLKKFFKANKVSFRETRSGNEITSLVVHDPEGHRISFVGIPGGPSAVVLVPGPPPQLVTAMPSNFSAMIHAGFVVKDRAAEDRFYKDILGFHVYWHGGMKDDGVDEWVDMQVPDGTDWLEYMLNVSPKADKKELGVMDHVAIGVADIHETYRQIAAKDVDLPEQPQIGRDGKWQLNLYDSDDTRIEFMERKPVNDPCCSPYQGPHPGESSKTQVPPSQ